MNRVALLILGMHRSGTSAIAGMLAHLGVTPPKTLMPATVDNPAGYWESLPIVQFHDRVLKEAQSHWDDWDRFDWRKLPPSIAQKFADELAAVLAAEFGEAPLMLVKDPRLSRLLLLWLDALRALGIQPRAVIAFRSPIEVAQSLQARDGIAMEAGLAIWLRHCLEAELHSRDIPRALLSYEALLRDWRSAARKIASRLSLEWPRFEEVAIDGFLKPQLRRQQGDAAADAAAPEWVRTTHAALSDLAAANGSSASTIATLDRIRGEFDRASEIFAPALRRLAQAPANIEVIRGEVPHGVHQFSIDVGRSESGAQLISGWVIAEPGRRVNAVKLCSDGKVIVSVPADLARPDVAEAFPDQSNAARSGFDLKRFLEQLPRDFVAQLRAELEEPGGMTQEHVLGTLRRSAV